MKIAINCIFYQPRGGGISEYIYNLVKYLEKLDYNNEYILYVLKDQVDYASKNFPSKFKIKTIPYGSSYLEVLKRSLFEQRFWNKEESIEKFDIFHSPFFHCPKFGKAKIVITVHDLRFYRFPYTYTLPRYLFLKYKVKNSVKAANHIITISQFTKDELIEAYQLSNDKITVIHEAINKERFSLNAAGSYKFPPEMGFLKTGRYLLSVGHIEPRKNYNRLIEAFCSMKCQKDCQDLKLVIVGKKGHHYEDVLKKVEETENVFYLNFVDHEFLQWLYRNASLFVFPSFYEGFGFPPLEAGCYGVVSAVSNVSSMPEVCGNAVFYFDPYNIENMASVISTALSDSGLREEKKLLMEEQINSFSWERNVRQTIDLYNQLGKL